MEAVGIVAVAIVTVLLGAAVVSRWQSRSAGLAPSSPNIPSPRTAQIAVSKLRPVRTSRLDALLARQPVQQDSRRRIRIPAKAVAGLVVAASATAVLVGQGVLALDLGVGVVVAILILLFGQELVASFGPDYWRWIGRRVAGTNRDRRGIRWALAVAIAVVAIPVMALLWWFLLKARGYSPAEVVLTALGDLDDSLELDAGPPPGEDQAP